MHSSTKSFSGIESILQDQKRSDHWDVLKILERLDEAPQFFDFGAGNVLVIRFTIEVIDARLSLFVPAVKSFLKKIEVGGFYELGSKRAFNFTFPDAKTSEWIIYVNRIKNLNPLTLSLKERVRWKNSARSVAIAFKFDESKRDRCLPVRNALLDCARFFETVKDISAEKLLSAPLKIVRLQHNQQIEVTESTGSVIKNQEYFGLTHNALLVRLYVPYFLKDLINQLLEKLLNHNLIINRLKVFYKRFKKNELYAGFLWDPTLSGFILQPKLPAERDMTLRDGDDYFAVHEHHAFLEDICHHDPWQPKAYQLDEEFFNDFDDAGDVYAQAEEFYQPRPRRHRNFHRG